MPSARCGSQSSAFDVLLLTPFSTFSKTPQVGFLSRRFLERLHAAAQGISPLEYIEAQTDRAKAAKAAFATAHGKPKGERVKVLYPTEDTVKTSKEKAGRHLIQWKGDGGLDDLQTGDLRKTVLRQLELKSGRLNGSAVRSLDRCSTRKTALTKAPTLAAYDHPPQADFARYK